MALGLWQILLILIIVLILFGSGKLPTVISELGRSLKDLKTDLREHGENDEPDR